MFTLLAILILGFIIVTHELGHYFVARLFNVGIIEFSVGMGPMLFSKRIGETVWSVRALPLGGFCAMYEEGSMESKGKADDEKKKDGFLSRLFGKRKEPDFKKDWTEDRSYRAKERWQQMLICLAGPAVNIITGFIFALLFTAMFGGAAKPTITKFVYDNCPAMEAGIEIGDEIIAVDNRNVLTSNDYTEYIKTNPSAIEGGYLLTVKRNGEIMKMSVTPDKETKLIGIMVNSELEKKNFPDTIKYAAHNSWFWVKIIGDSFGMLIRGDAHMNDMSGLLGTTAVMSKSMKAASVGQSNFNLLQMIMSFVTFISINLGVMNILPIPLLDGGRTLMIMIEGVLNRKIPEKIEYAMFAMSALFLLSLMLYTLLIDFVKIVMNKI